MGAAAGSDLRCCSKTFGIRPCWAATGGRGGALMLQRHAWAPVFKPASQERAGQLRIRVGRIDELTVLHSHLHGAPLWTGASWSHVSEPHAPGREAVAAPGGRLRPGLRAAWPELGSPDPHSDAGNFLIVARRTGSC